MQTLIGSRRLWIVRSNVRCYYVYILSNRLATVLYVGVTNDLTRRMDEHRAGVGSKFCDKYNVDRLVYFESFRYVTDAINREKQLKRWRRSWKVDLVRSVNPAFVDLSPELYWMAR